MDEYDAYRINAISSGSIYGTDHARNITTDIEPRTCACACLYLHRVHITLL